VYLYSAGYQASYLLPEFIISVVLLTVLQRTLIQRKA